MKALKNLNIGKADSWFELAAKPEKVYAGIDLSDLISKFTAIRKYRYGRVLSKFDFYYAYTRHIQKDGSRKKVIESPVDSYYEYTFILADELKSFIKDWVAIPEREAELIYRISYINDKIFSNWVVLKNGNMLADPKELELAKCLLTKQLKPFVIKGTDYPYWLKVKNELLSSTTSIWFKYLFDYLKVLTPVWLEEYNGEDKEKEHSSVDD